MTDTNRTELLRTIMADLIAQASEEDLADMYYAIRPQHKPTEPPPGQTPLSTTQLVERALQRAGHPVKFRDVLRLVRQEVPGVSEGRVSGTLSKLTQQGQVIRRGPQRGSEYSLR